MIRSFRKFFEFAGRQSRNWYLGLFYEIIRCILEALQFAALLVVLDGLVRDISPHKPRSLPLALC